MYLKMCWYRVPTDIVVESSCKSQIYMLLQKRSKQVSLCKNAQELYFTYTFFSFVSSPISTSTFILSTVSLVLPASVSSTAIAFESRIVVLLDVVPELVLQLCINFLAM